jgi:hypothetical protein
VEADSYEGGASHSSYTEVNQWLLRGDNTVRIRYDLPSGNASDSGEAHLDVQLYWVAPGDEELLPGRTECDYHWKHEPGGLYPVVFTQPFGLPGFPETALFLAGPLPAKYEGERADLQQDIDAISAQVGALAGAFLRRDSVVYRLQRVKMEDVAKSRYQGSPRELEELESEALNFVAGLEGLEYHEPAGPLQFRVTGENRFVHVVCPGASRALEYTLSFTYRYEGEAQYFFINLYFAKIDGEWLIIR